jgi:hypothetical protein
VRLRDFDPDLPGGCKGRAVDMPLVQIVATAESQTANTMRMVRAFAPKGSKVVAAHGLDWGKTQFYKTPEGTLEVITSSSNAAEGAEASFIVADESEHWVPSKGGPELAATLQDNLTKSGNRMLETCNAWVPGLGSVAETSWDGWVAQEEGRTRGQSKILYDARIAPPDTRMDDEESLTQAIRHVYGDCWWVKPRPIVERIWDPRSSPDASKRKYLNWPTVAVDAWVTPQEWAKLVDRTRTVRDREDIVMFFDGSKSRDATALVGCCVSDGHIFTIGAWEPDTTHDANSVVPVSEVNAAVRWAFDSWNVRAFFADVKEWESFVKVSWPEEYGDQLEIWALPTGKEPQVIAWDMRTKAYDFAQAVELTEAEIREEKFTHDGDSRMARHVANARRRPHRLGVVSIGKESPDSPRKIDLAVSMVGARMVRRLLIAGGGKEKKRSGKVW